MALTGLAAAVVFYVYRWWTDPLHAIPTVGGSSVPFLSYLSARKFMPNGKRYIEEGYKKYPRSAFKVPLLDKWMVILSGPKMVEEVRLTSDKVLSFSESTEQAMQLKGSFSREFIDDQYHTGIIKDKLTRSLPAILPDVIDELNLAVPQHIPAKEDEWLAVPIMEAMRQIIARASSRIFVGVPTCRNQEYLDLAINLTIVIASDGLFYSRYPDFLKPWLSRYWSNASKSLEKSMQYLGPVISQRRAMMEKWKTNDWSDKPNDFLQWIMDMEVTKGNSDKSIAERVMIMNFAAIHTSSNSISHVFHRLADHPECIQPLREEIQTVIADEGWTKAAMGKMWKLDSVLKEAQRYDGIGLVSMPRLALQDVTLHDGTFIPRGTSIVVASAGAHHDDNYYANASVFDPFRFSRMRELDGESTKHQFVNTSPTYLTFGHGKHACPGRFFAANEIKSLLAFILLNYDFKKLNDDDQWPVDHWGFNIIPAESGKLLFRRRREDTVYP
ncbi:cytochrome P450 [Trametes elegans]|nr:cytochrome P450 [Trametes elegans]